MREEVEGERKPAGREESKVWEERVSGGGQRAWAGCRRGVGGSPART